MSSYNREYYEKNKEAIKAKQKARYAARREQEVQYQREYRGRNPERLKAWRDAKYAANPEPFRARQRVYNRKKSGMLDPPAETRAGACELCLLEFDCLHLDHDHSTGIIRGWLCSTCNRALGLFRDSPDTMRRAAVYVETRGKHVTSIGEANDGEGRTGDSGRGG